VSKIIKTISPETNIIGNKNSPRSGAFEVKLDDKTIYSKFSTNTFPNEEDINSWFI
jgi:selT/selW/selH-like putative selenoprotein